ncbi:glycoside hydrolase family 127 protein [Kineococcus indalonis]|uniref:glycoside hydrolase family 127 protein n=1 Tax=Kineococcus indalonis TaxID=2696566 RepID=UPI0014122A28|nr:beta-L-arabinofuranosidase domain-containing protein [Kineococcus indalonis]NAZ84816.1 glycoside hydrolase family 127 protein [Kineococcus indalonis]
MTTTASPTSAAVAPAAPTSAAAVALRPVPTGASRITAGFWHERQEANRRQAIRTGYEKLQTAGNLQNLRIAAGTATGEVRGPIFMDSDVYKWLEAAGWEYGRGADAEVLGWIREVTEVVAAAQAEDGYLDSVQQVRGRGERYVDLPWSHEHYCAGHLFQAAVAVHRTTGETGLLDVAVKLADHLVATFGPGRIEEVDGHPVVEMGLVELYRETGTREYLDLARWFVDARGHGIIETKHGKQPTYFSDRVPVREATSPEGHAVRAVYLTAGAADVAAETADGELLTALARQWEGMLASKTYVTGGIGSRWDWEQFGDHHELSPDRAYAETCAAIGSVQWSWRMLLATGEARYADLVERTLYNAFLPGVSLAGTEYFYVNPLQLRHGAHAEEERSAAHGRRAWFDCACCPPNIMRTLSSLDAYVATSSAAGVQLHQFATGTVQAGGARLRVATDYPWDGAVRVEVADPGTGAWELALRVPAWAEGATATVAGEAVEVRAGEYLRLHRTWSAGDVVELTLPMGVRVVEADPRVDAVRGCVAVERGPLVYALEQTDLPEGLVADDVRVRVAELRGAPAEHRPELLEGVTVLQLPVHAAVHADEVPLYRPAGDEPAPQAAEEVLTVPAVPYYAWANRDLGAMRVWLPRA